MTRGGRAALAGAGGLLLRKGPVLGFLALCLLLLAPGHASAASPACTLTIANINFGSSVDVLPGGAVTVTGSWGLSCSGFGHSEIDRFCLNLGSGSGVSGSQRQLISGSNTLNYDLYQNSAYSTLWGSWQTGFDSAGMQIDITSNSSGNISTSIPIYAKLFASQQTAAPGSYSSVFPNSTSGAYATFAKAAGTNCPTGANHAQTGFSVLATVITSCYVNATTLNFGTAGLLSSLINATSTVSAQCTKGTPYNVGLNAGTTAGGTTTTRLMANGPATISYKMFSDSARTINWGNTIGTDTVGGTGTGNNQALTVYGQVPVQTSVAPGTYSDTVTATVTY
jgi:spore coat protein U-like protein